MNLRDNLETVVGFILLAVLAAVGFAAVAIVAVIQLATTLIALPFWFAWKLLLLSRK